MRRWNGWGEEQIEYPLPSNALHYIEEIIGPGKRFPDASIEQVIKKVPPARLPSQSIYSIEPFDRVSHARGQSLPDWIALRYGNIDCFPDGVAYPNSSEEIRQIIEYAQHNDISLIPYGGGTSVVGHINPLPSERPIVTIDLSRLNRLLELDETSQIADFEAGVTGSALETQLKPYGFTLGHFPQSFELSTLGGWIATRSSGQQSYYYGRIEEQFIGGHIETPIGSLDLPVFPASAAGPDIKNIISGSEGRLGIITHACVRVHRIPERDDFFAAFFRDWPSGIEALRKIAQSQLPVSMMRLSDPIETETTLVLSGKEKLASIARRGLDLLGYKKGRCLLIYGLTGDDALTRKTRSELTRIISAYSGLPAGQVIGNIWRKSRFKTPYLRNSLWDHGFALDTVETAVPWTSVIKTAQSIQNSLRINISDRPPLVFSHLSHIYEIGASIYTTFLFRRTNDPAETLEKWQLLKKSVSQAIIECGGTISHQHGVGLDHANYLVNDKGAIGIKMLQKMVKAMDPQGILNPGKLVSPEN